MIFSLKKYFLFLSVIFSFSITYQINAIDKAFNLFLERSKLYNAKIGYSNKPFFKKSLFFASEQLKDLAFPLIMTQMGNSNGYQNLSALLITIFGLREVGKYISRFVTINPKEHETFYSGYSIDRSNAFAKQFLLNVTNLIASTFKIIGLIQLHSYLYPDSTSKKWFVTQRFLETMQKNFGPNYKKDKNVIFNDVLTKYETYLSSLGNFFKNNKNGLTKIALVASLYYYYNHSPFKSIQEYNEEIDRLSNEKRTEIETARQQLRREVPAQNYREAEVYESESENTTTDNRNSTPQNIDEITNPRQKLNVLIARIKRNIRLKTLYHQQGGVNRDDIGTIPFFFNINKIQNYDLSRPAYLKLINFLKKIDTELTAINTMNNSELQSKYEALKSKIITNRYDNYQALAENRQDDFFDEYLLTTVYADFDTITSYFRRTTEAKDYPDNFLEKMNNDIFDLIIFCEIAKRLNLTTQE